MSFPFNHIGIIATIIFLSGVSCSKKEDPVRVDFSKTVEVERPSDLGTTFQEEIRVAIGAMVSPKKTLTYYQDLLNYLGAKLGKRVVLAQRKTYGEINEMLGKGEIDLAFLCSGPYVVGRDKYGFQLLAAPEVAGSHFYSAYFIVNKESEIERPEHLKGRTFAFTDPESNTGYLFPLAWLKRLGSTPRDFFGETLFTYSHDNSILAVSKGLVDGASVDGLIWEFFNITNPELTAKTRIICKSENFGIPPVVAGKNLSDTARNAIKEVLFTMREDPEGACILDKLMIDRFVATNDAWYDSIRRMIDFLGVGANFDERHAESKD